jgi:hypothetical protein
VGEPDQRDPDQRSVGAHAGDGQRGRQQLGVHRVAVVRPGDDVVEVLDQFTSGCVPTRSPVVP